MGCGATTAWPHARDKLAEFTLLIGGGGADTHNCGAQCGKRAATLKTAGMHSRNDVPQ
jgi:hypothetical protein